MDAPARRVAGSDTHRHARLVEFVGLPGAGKTALARRVCTLLRIRGYRATEPLGGFVGWPWWRKSPRALWYLAAHPAEAWPPLRAIRQSRQRSWLDAAKVAHNWLVVRALMCERRRPETILLLDQGVFQALWSIGLCAGDGAVLARFAARLRCDACLPEVVVVVEVDARTAAERLGRRPYGGSRLERGSWDPALFVRGVEVWRDVRRLIGRLAHERKDLELVVVGNDRPECFEETARALAARIGRSDRGGAHAGGSGAHART